jgi:hypothetical protein
LGQSHKFGGVEPIDFNLPLVNNLISNVITDINKQYKNLHRFYLTKKYNTLL